MTPRNGMLLAIGAAALMLSSDNAALVKALPRPRVRRGVQISPEELEQRRALAQARARAALPAGYDQAQADAKRHARARKHMTQVLAGGFGRAAQLEAWDQVFPRWRGVLEVMRRAADGPLPPEDRALLDEASAFLRANNSFLGGPWPSFVATQKGPLSGV